MGIIGSIIGSDPRTILWWQMCIRAIFIFLFALILLKLGSRRAFGKNTNLDIIVAVILGSILSRALTANAKFFPTLAASASLILVHFVLGQFAFYNQTIGYLVKGKEIQLVADGQIDWSGMKRASFTEHDLLEALRLQKGVADVAKIQDAYLERSGKVSFITREQKS